MKYNGIAGFKTTDEFVADKLRKFKAMPHTFESMCGLMFAEGDNVMYERTEGFRIQKTTYSQSRANIEHKAAALATILANYQEQCAIVGGDSIHEEPKVDDINCGNKISDSNQEISDSDQTICDSRKVVGIYLDNSLDWIELFWAILRVGGTPLLLNMRLSDATIEGVLTEMHAVAVVSESKNFTGVQNITLAEILLAAGEGKIDSEWGNELFVMSSGTSSSVKVCAYTGEEFMHQVEASCNLIKKCRAAQNHYEGNLKQLMFLPLYHIFGLTAMYVWFAFFSRTFVELRDLAPDTILSTIRRHKVTHIFAVPMFWDRVYDGAVREIRERGQWQKLYKGVNLARKMSVIPPLGRLFSKIAFREVRENLFGDSIQFMITGGSMIRAEVLEFFNAVGYPLADGYGMSEIGITSVELGNARWRMRPSVGEPMLGVEYKIVPEYLLNENPKTDKQSNAKIDIDSLNETESDEPGVLFVRSKSMAKYIIEGGVCHENQGTWFNTRDIMFKDETGRYYPAGRVDDLVIGASGENMNPNLIEPFFNGLASGVRGVSLVSGANKEAVLVISVNPHMTAIRASSVIGDVRRIMSESNLSGSISRVVLTTDALIEPDQFKMNRRLISEKLASGALKIVKPEELSRGTDDTSVDATILASVREFIALSLHIDASEVGNESDFYLDLGGSSLDYFATMSALESEYSVKFPNVSGIQTDDGDGRTVSLNSEQTVALTTPIGIAQYIEKNS